MPIRLSSRFSHFRKLLSPAAHASGLALSDQVVSSVATFLTAIIVGRACTQDQLGVFHLGISIIMTALIVQNSFISSPYSVYLPRMKGPDRARYTGNTLFFQAGWSILAVAGLAVVAAVRQLRFGGGALSALLWTLALVVGLVLLRDYVRRICFARLDYGGALVLDFAAATLQIVLLSLLAVSGLLSATRAWTVIGLSSGTVVLWWFVRHRRRFSHTRIAIDRDWSRHWKIGKWLFSSGVFWQSSVIIYPWLLASFHGIAATGIWAACVGVVAISTPIIAGLESLFGPVFSHSYAEDGVDAMRKNVLSFTKVYSGIVGAISCFVILFRDDLLLLFYGEKYSEYGLIVIPLALSLAFSPARIAASKSLVIVEKARLDFVTNSVSFVVFVVLGIWMTKEHGPLGAACAVLLGNALVTMSKWVACGIALRSLRGANMPR